MARGVRSTEFDPSERLWYLRSLFDARLRGVHEIVPRDFAPQRFR